MSLRLLDRAGASGALATYDIELAYRAGRVLGVTDEAVLYACALTSRAAREGHVCVNVRQLANRISGDMHASAAANLPERLLATGIAASPGGYAPLVLEPTGHVFLRRYWAYETGLAAALRAHVLAGVPPLDDSLLARALEHAFGPVDPPEPDEQRLAAAVALLRPLSVIIGGPGTGKTTTAARILAALAAVAGESPPRVALAAPTGKAAARLQEAIAAYKSRSTLDARTLAAIPDEASTVHRLLGTLPGTTRPRRDRSSPLAFDVVVIDEASMIDLALMAKLVEAVAPHTRIVLLGDANQLASVEAGAVLASLCAGPPGYSPSLAERLERLTGHSVPRASRVQPLTDSVSRLTRRHRFADLSVVGRLAAAVADGEAELAIELAGADADPSPDRLRSWSPIEQAVATGYGPFMQAVAERRSVGEVFRALASFRVLAPHRGGPMGVSRLNRMIERLMRLASPVAATGEWYAGRVVMIERNDYALRLFNGDVGIALADPRHDGALRVFFEAGREGWRSIAPARLPKFDAAFALTVHKSQGSEFDAVALVLPSEASSAITTRELIYTAITRARDRVLVLGDPGVLRAAIAAPQQRAARLAERLWGDGADEQPAH